MTLSEEEMTSLMAQAAKRDVTKSYETYLQDEAFADAEVFGIDKDQDQGTAYVYLTDGEYVALKDKAYLMSGAAGMALIVFKYTDDGIALTDIVWSADSGEHEEWMKENFPEAYLEKANAYEAYDENGHNILDEKMKETVVEEMRVSAVSDDLLNIDLEKGTYEIVRVIEDGTTFETETVAKGQLGDL